MDSILETKEVKETAPRSGGGFALAASVASAVLAVILLGVTVYLFLQLRSAKADLAAMKSSLQEVDTKAAGTEKRARELDLGLAAVKGQTAAIAERAGVTEAELDRTAATARQLREDQRKGQEGLANLGGEVGKVKDEVAASKAAIEQTQAQLQRAIGDLGEQSGLIARNAEELAALKRSGTRDYFEFDLRKAKVPSPVGPVAIRVKDTDAKRHKFNILLTVDDLEIEKKDKTLLEPVQFYRKGSRQLHEIVVYSIQKDRITGYLSTPKAAETATTK
jgi:septal ring factor EnvC (AmiA/AmiB activator)